MKLVKFRLKMWLDGIKWFFIQFQSIKIDKRDVLSLRGTGCME